MLAEHAGDVVVDDHDLVDLAVPLLGEHADRGRTASDPHPLFGHAVHDWRIAGLHHHGRAAVDGDLHRLAVAQIHQRIAGDAAFFLRPAGQMMNAAERQHLRAVFAGRHMPHRLALHPNGCGFRPEKAVGIDLHLDAAIAEDAFSDDRDHIDAIDLRGHDERRRLVIGIGGAGADRGDEHILFVNDLAVPVAAGLERHQPSAMRYRPLQKNMRIDAHQLAVVIGVAVARAGRPRLDVAHHRAGIAADLVGSRRVRRHARNHFHSYTNDFARAAKDCQARLGGSVATLTSFQACPDRFVRVVTTLKSYIFQRPFGSDIRKRTPPPYHTNVRTGTPALHVCMQTVFSKHLSTIRTSALGPLEASSDPPLGQRPDP